MKFQTILSFLMKLERNNGFKKGYNLPMIDEFGDAYQHNDDLEVVLKTTNDISVISESS